METNKKKGKFYMKLNSLEQNPNDPSLLNALFVIHDFEESWNGQIITEDVTRENMNSLLNKPIVCDYINKDDNNGLDALTDHQQFKDTDRNTGEEFISTATNAIGVFTDVYIDDFTDVEGVTKRVLYGKAALWFDKCRNVCLLLDEWLGRDILVPASVEYMYYNYNVQDGIEYLQSPLVYLAHALLNAEDRNDYEQVYPAYDSARLVNLNMADKWNTAVAQIKDVEKDATRKEGNKVEMLKKVCEISQGDLRWKIYGSLSKVMTAEEYNTMWISDYDIYDDYFIYESFANDNYEYYKVTYSKDNEKDEVSVGFESKSKVERTVKWEEMSNSVVEAETKMKELEIKLEEVEASLNEKVAEVSSITSEKEDVAEKLNEATVSLTTLNSKLTELEEIESKYNEEKFEKALNEKLVEFKAKFKGVNALDKFESEEVQGLVEKSVTDSEALFTLNSMLVELIPEKKEEPKEKLGTIKDFNTKKIENLTPKDNSFESRYLL